MAEEMRLHLELQTERNRVAGMSETEARFAARRQFGGIEQIKEQCRDQRGWRWLEEGWADARFAGRMLRKHPGFTIAAVLTLALGIGFVTTLFTMINGVVFGQLPFEEPEKIVAIDVPAMQFDDYARRQQGCAAFAFAQPTSANVRGGEFASRYPAAIVSANFLDVLRARPLVGRGFLPEDARPGATRTVLIRHSVWARDFDLSPSAVGREIRVNGELHTIVGVMPAGFGFPFNQEIWIPRRTDEPIEGGLVFGRLRPGVSARQAANQFTALAATLAQETGAPAERVPAVEVVPFAERHVKDALRVMLSAAMGATLLVLLLACANVANLMLARALDRRREMAVRAATGASRGRLIRQMLTESLFVALLGAGGGLMIAGWSTQALWAYIRKEQPLTGGGPFWINFDLDGRVFVFVAAAAVLASLFTGLVPAVRASRVDVNDALKDGGGASPRVSRFTRVLVNAQMAFSVCLVTVAGLFVSVLIAFNHKQLPYDPSAVFTARISLDGRRYDDAAVRRRFFAQLVERLAAAPGVEAAGLTSAESLRNAPTRRIELEGATYARPEDRPACAMETVSADFLDAYGVGLIRGRAFGTADTARTPAVGLVNAVFADRFGEGGDVLGRRFRLSDDGANPPAWITVIGVVPDLGSVKAGRTSAGAVIYRPLAQEDERAMTILTRGTGDVSRFARTIRSEVAALDPDLPVARLETVQQIIALERIGMNSLGSLFVVCGLGALLLASVGIYGVISFAVKLRTREFGVRMALGAERGAIARMVLGDGIRQISAGLATGVLLAVVAAAGLRAFFEGVGRSGFDVWPHFVVAAVLAAVGGVALLIPARRAARVDPMVALRCE